MMRRFMPSEDDLGNNTPHLRYSIYVESSIDEKTIHVYICILYADVKRCVSLNISSIYGVSAL
jgi:hypothetical protein